MEMEHFIKEDVLVPVGYKICDVMPLPNYQVSKSVLIYKADDITIRQLIDQYEQNERLAQKLKNNKEKICFLLGKNKLSVEEDDTLKKLKHKLHNYKIKNFVFYPYIQKYGAMVLQCAPTYENHEDYCDQQNANNKITTSLSFPQLSKKVIYCSFYSNRTVSSQMISFLKTRDFAQNAKLWQYEMEIECLNCSANKKIDLKRLVSETFQDAHNMQVTFPKMVASLKNDQRQKVIIRIYKCKGNLIKQFTYADIGDHSIESIKNFCSQQNEKWDGLRILNSVLKSFELLSSQHSNIMETGGIIDAYIVYEGQFFYRTLADLNVKKIDLNDNETKNKIQVEMHKKIEEKRVQQITYQLFVSQRNKRLSQFDQNVNKQFKKIEFFDPFWCYTSPWIHEKLNRYLSEQNFLKLRKNDIRSSWDIQFTFCLINSLLKLPNYQGTVYRGQRMSYDFQVGSIQCFKSFISTSRSKEVARKFLTNTLFTIQCFSGKYIEQFSYFPHEEEVLMFPYTNFQVISVEYINGVKNIKLQELPAPKRLNQNLVVWVDDKPQNNTKFFNEFKIEKPLMKSELIQLVSNDHLKLWLEYYGHHLLNPSIKVMAITNMRRKEDDQAGIETIKLQRQLDPNIEINIFVENSPRALQMLTKNKMAQSEKLILENREAQLIENIKKKIIQTEKVEEESLCEVM